MPEESLLANTPTMTDPEVQKRSAEIRELCAKHARGDIRERPFQRILAERTVALYRASVQGFMTEGEAILEEHHVVLGHTKLTQSMLKEPEQHAISLFATDRRLFRLRSTIAPGRPVTCNEEDKTEVDQVSFDQIHSLLRHRQVRSGEIWTGGAILGLAVIFYSWLAITGTLLIGLGMLGIIHGLFLPTRWIEVTTHYPTDKDPILIYSLRRGSGKRLVKVLRERTACRVRS